MDINVEYKINDNSFKHGEEISGQFVVVAVGIEQSIPFTIKYVKRPLIASTGEIHSLQEFADLAQSRFSEAVAVFYSDRLKLMWIMSSEEFLDECATNKNGKNF